MSDNNDITFDDLIVLLSEYTGVSEADLKKASSSDLQYFQYFRNNTDEQAGSNDRNYLLPAPKKLPVDSTCEYEQVAFEDVLYIPVHPITNNPAFYAVTKEAKDIIKKEIELLKNNSDDIVSIRQKLRKLGILSRFVTDTYECFMDDETAKSYVYDLIALRILEDNAAKYCKLGETEFVRNLAQKRGIDVNIL